MSEEDLERYEAEIELGLVQEYRAVLPVFSYVIETERRFYLANEVSLKVRSDTTPACIELELKDAWVWDMYRPARFVPTVNVVTFRDVNIERLPEQELQGVAQSVSRALGQWGLAHMAGRGRPFSGVTSGPVNHRIALGRSGEDRAAAWYAHQGYQIIERNWRSRTGEIDLVCARDEVLVFCEVKTRCTDRLGAPVEAVTRVKQLRLRRLAAEYIFLHTCGRHQPRFDVASILGRRLTVIEGAF